MLKRYNRIIYLIIALTFLTACNSGDWLNSGSLPTATFTLARFATSTATLSPTDTPITEPTNTTTATPQIQLTPTSTSQTATPIATTASEVDELEPTSPPPTATATTTATTLPTVTLSPTVSIPATAEPTVAAVAPTATIAPSPAALSGRIAFPIDDGGGHYDVWVIELPPDEPPFLIQTKARQPNFSSDGRLLVKTQGGDLGESIGLLDANYTWLGIINESPEDSYPFWDPDSTRYTYSNSNLVKDPDTAHLAPYIFTTCSLQIPRFENTVECQDFRQWGSIEVGEAPVWTTDDRIVFFTYKGDDGLYFVENALMLRDAGGLGPKQLLVRSNGRPTDTAGDQVFFSAGDIDGNWEAYAIDLDGNNLTNLSQSPASQDGLPTVSPDGNWVAFVSDRDGSWGIWVTPLAGGTATKVVDFSQINTSPSPWGEGNRAWMLERISWGP